MNLDNSSPNIIQANIQLSILFVDDTLGWLEVMKRILEKEGNWHVQTCQKPDEAYQFLINQKFDIIISDYNMNKINGIDFFRSLRQKGIKTPFILYSCYSKEEILKFKIDDEKFYFFQKTGNIVQFIKIVHNIINDDFYIAL